MSLVDDNRKHQREVVPLKDNCKLVIPKQILDKIAFLHKEVTKNTEWSCILIYKTIEGSIEDHENWIIEVEDIIPMDVGTSGYTEYEIKAEDEYATDIWMEALMQDKKMGHLHTHHSMATFFSGTDMSELHDNAPKHSYYLSLIVNYQEPKNWIAKVAICGQTVRKGTKKVEGNIKTISSWSASTEPFEQDIDLNKEEVIDETKDILYTIDCDLIFDSEANIPVPFAERVKEICKPKRSFHYSGNYHQRHASSLRQLNAIVGKEIGSETSFDRTAHSTGMMSLFPEDNKIGGKRTDNDKEQAIENRPKNCFDAASVKPFLAKLLSQDMECTDDIGTVFINSTRLSEKQFEALVDAIDINFEKQLSKYFQIKNDLTDAHAVAISCLDIMTPFRSTDLYKRVSPILDEFILPTFMASNSITKYLTGIDMDNN